MALQRVAGSSWSKFYDMLNKAYPRYGHTIPLMFDESFEDNKPKLKLTGFDQQLKGLLSVPSPQKEEKALKEKEGD